MPNCQRQKGKRRRSHPLENNEPPKKARYDDMEPCSANSVSEIESREDSRRRRHRRRTKGLRELIKNKIEVALRTSTVPLSHLFTSRDDAGTPQAPYLEIVRSLGLSHEDQIKAATLSPRAVESISNITDMFCIEMDAEEKLMVKYRATDWSVEDCTVYLDNLPAGCTSDKICRIARKFGTVVEVRLPKSSTRMIPCMDGLIEMGKRPRSFAFVQFTEPESCRSMCDAFAHNAPGLVKKENCPSLVPLLQRLLSKIRTLSKLRRRRTFGQDLLLMRLRRQQAAIIRKERTANRKANRLARAIEKEKLAALSPEERKGRKIHENGIADGERDHSNQGISERRRQSFEKKKKAKAQRLLSPAAENTAKKKRKRRRRRKRRTHAESHAINGSLSDYFCRIQVIPFVRYLELRKEYLNLRRNSLSRTNEHVKHDHSFSEFASRLSNMKMGHKLNIYRECFWGVETIEGED